MASAASRTLGGSDSPTITTGAAVESFAAEVAACGRALAGAARWSGSRRIGKRRRRARRVVTAIPSRLVVLAERADPDVPVPDRIAVVLQLERELRGMRAVLRDGAVLGGAEDLLRVLDADAVVE